MNSGLEDGDVGRIGTWISGIHLYMSAQGVDIIRVEWDNELRPEEKTW